jgi:Ca2+-binding RTX toxin-like protein
MAIVKGTTGNDWINASDGVTNDADIIYGYDGNDVIFGMGGNDLLKGGGGADWLDGGEGFDTASYSDSAQAVQIYLHLGIVQGGTADGDTLVSIENLTGSNYGDILSGDDGSNVLNGLAGDDMLFGRGGADTLNGGNGNDILVGGAGADTLNGGSGFDEVEYLNSPTGVYVSLQSGKGSSGDAQGDQLIGIESIYGSTYDDWLVGDDDANCLWGDGGADVIYGYGGDDSIYGHNGTDWLYGMDGIDFISGGPGADHIRGGLGDDTLWGGSGADIFLWSSAAEAEYDLANLGCSTDHICDFNHTEGDVIDLSAIDANENVTGNQGFTFIDTAAFSGNPGEINYFYDGGDTYIQLQTDASPDVEGMIRLVGIHTPDASWFML